MTLPLAVRGFRQVAQHVVDLPRAVAWYAVDGVRLLLDRGAPAALLYLEVPDVAHATDGLRAAGITVATEPHVVFDDPDGRFGRPGEAEVLAFVRDSEGNLLGLMGRRSVDRAT